MIWLLLGNSHCVHLCHCHKSNKHFWEIWKWSTVSNVLGVPQSSHPILILMILVATRWAQLMCWVSVCVEFTCSPGVFVCFLRWLWLPLDLCRLYPATCSNNPATLKRKTDWGNKWTDSRHTVNIRYYFLPEKLPSFFLLIIWPCYIYIQQICFV